MTDEKRMAGDYEIIHAIKFGGTELVLGVNMDDPTGQFYMTAECESNAIMRMYNNVSIIGRYAHIVELFAHRLEERALKVIEQQKDEPEGMITPDMCEPDSRDRAILGEVAVIKPSILLPEYRSAVNQLIYPTGGFGSAANSRGNAVYCRSIYTGKQIRFERYDIMGILKPEHYPDWLKEKLSDLIEKVKKSKEMER